MSSSSSSMSAFGTYENDQQNINEIKAEEEAMNKSLHQPMKSWFNALTSSKFKEKYGPFPPFWQDMSTYPHMKIVKKLYLKTNDMGTGEYDIDEIEIKVLATQAETADSRPPVADHNDLAPESESTSGRSGGEAEAKPKKRKSRWGGEDNVNTQSTTATSTSSSDLTEGVAESKEATTSSGGEPGGDCKKRKSRFTTASDATGPGALGGAEDKSKTPLTQEMVQQSLVFQMQLKQINDRLPYLANEAAAIELDPNRSPSPPPKYDINGKRTNKREDRMREALTEERNSLIASLIKINPNYVPPADYVKPKPLRRIYIPVKEYPQYNFIGLVIGPRGNTQKKLEQDTNCKISIRGKGSLKDGSKGRAKQPDDDDELHVHITGETEEGLEKACKLVEELLTPIDDDKNEHKQKQLKELALINGTLREEDFCSVCGEKGHRQYECPHRAKSFKAAGVKCAICGDLSHPTRDCPLKQDGMEDASTIDSEYNSFMSELGGGLSSSNDAGATTQNGTVGSSVIKPQIIEAEYIDPNPKPKPMVPITAAPGTQVVTELVWDAATLMGGNMNPSGAGTTTNTTMASEGTQQTSQLPTFAMNSVAQPSQPATATQLPATQLVSTPYWNPATGQITYVQTQVPVYPQYSAQPCMPTPQASAPAPPPPPGPPPSS